MKENKLIVVCVGLIVIFIFNAVPEVRLAIITVLIAGVFSVVRMQWRKIRKKKGKTIKIVNSGILGIFTLAALTIQIILLIVAPRIRAFEDMIISFWLLFFFTIIVGPITCAKRAEEESAERKRKLAIKIARKHIPETVIIEDDNIYYQIYCWSKYAGNSISIFCRSLEKSGIGSSARLFYHKGKGKRIFVVVDGVHGEEYCMIRMSNPGNVSRFTIIYKGEEPIFYDFRDNMIGKLRKNIKGTTLSFPKRTRVS